MTRPDKRISQLASERAEEFDATLLSNRVHEQLSGAHERNLDLRRVVELAEGCYDLWSDRDHDDDVGSAAFDAAEALNDEVDTVVAEEIAKACATIVTEAEGWTDFWADDEVADARREAATWLDVNIDAVERAGVLEDVAGVVTPEVGDA
jgi:hypothetical protein